jgi:hypothetical protein
MGKGRSSSHQEELDEMRQPGYFDDFEKMAERTEG